MSTFAQDLRFALRTHRKGWTVSLIAIFSLALAIGGNTTVFSLVHALLFRPQPYDEPERVVMFAERQKTQSPNASALGTSMATYLDLRERSRSISLWSAMEPRTLSVRRGEVAEPMSAVAVAPSFFEVLRVGAWRGRTFTAEEGVEGGPRVALPGYDHWLARYGEQNNIDWRNADHRRCAA